MIDELRIENFRGFASLALKDLQQVNLVVGENDAGKTSLLEAILLLCDLSRVTELPALFRPSQGNPDVRYFRWLLRDGSENRRGFLRCRLEGRENEVLLGAPGIPIHAFAAGVPGVPPQHIYNGAVQIIKARELMRLTCREISVQHRDANTLVGLVGKAQRKSTGEETLQKMLAAVDPRIKKVRVDPGEDAIQVIVDIGLSELIPVSQAGQGVYRLMTILADLVGESPDVLLIDEIENGLHHSVHEQIWTGLAAAAEMLGVQIFATTHSSECLRAAHTAFQSRPNYNFSVIQLFRLKSGVQGRVLDREHIEAAVSGNIDLR